MSETLDTWVWCGHCGAAAWGVSPHGQHEPCPLTIERFEFDKERARATDAAYIAKLDAERMYYVRSGLAAEEGLPAMADSIKRALGGDDD